MAGYKFQMSEIWFHMASSASYRNFELHEVPVRPIAYSYILETSHAHEVYLYVLTCQIHQLLELFSLPPSFTIAFFLAKLRCAGPADPLHAPGPKHPKWPGPNSLQRWLRWCCWVSLRISSPSPSVSVVFLWRLWLKRGANMGITWAPRRGLAVYPSKLKKDANSIFMYFPSRHAKRSKRAKLASVQF